MDSIKAIRAEIAGLNNTLFAAMRSGDTEAVAMLTAAIDDAVRRLDALLTAPHHQPRQEL